MMILMTQIRRLIARAPACLASFLLLATAGWGQIEDPAFQIRTDYSEDCLLGGDCEVDVFLHSADPEAEFGSFDFTFAYHGAALIFQKASVGELISDCGWEYFAYVYEPATEWGTASPMSLIRVVGVADVDGTSGGSYIPGCPAAEELPLVFLRLSFRVPLDCRFAYQGFPVQFYWTDCLDNTIQNRDGTVLYLSQRVFVSSYWTDPFTGDEMTGDGSQTFPSLRGAHDNCLLEFESGDVYRSIDFENGFVSMAGDAVCLEPSGDINVNGIGPEVADVVMFQNYFLQGLAAFGDNPEWSVYQSDVNHDGIALSVADLQHLIRLIARGGPDPRAGKTAPLTVALTQAGKSLRVDRAMAAAYIVTAGRSTPLMKADMEMRYNFDGRNTRILIFDPAGQGTFSGEFLEIDGHIVSAEFATLESGTVSIDLLPGDFELRQNYPNPFNPMTVIEFSIPGGGSWTMDVFNITGQLVRAFSGVAEADSGRIEWDASDLPSGVYFYRMTAGQNSVSRKAVLLK